MRYLISPEPLTDILLNSRGNNGDIIKTIAIARNVKKSNIYVEIINDGVVRPTVYRGYKNENGELIYNTTVYADIQPSSSAQMVMFGEDLLNPANYIVYRIEFESLRDNNVVEIESIGLYFDKFDATLDHIKVYDCELLSDINQKPLASQKYSKTQSFSLIMNNSHKGELLALIDKPYYLIEIIDNCLNNSTQKLIETNTVINYITSATKIIQVKIDNLVGK